MIHRSFCSVDLISAAHKTSPHPPGSLVSLISNIVFFISFHRWEHTRATLGIANHGGKPSEQQAQAIVASALAAGISVFDTAAGYGDSETRLGRIFYALQATPNIVTKLASGITDEDASNMALAHAFVQSSLHQSMFALRVSKIDTLLLHRFVKLQVGDRDGV